MKRIKAITLASAIIAAMTQAGAQEAEYAQLKAYDAQNRQAVEGLYVRIRQAGVDAAKRAAIEDGLVGVLSDPAATFAGKQEACRMLWEIGTERSVPVVAKLLTDERLSDPARYALERNASPAAGKALVAALGSAQGKVLVGLLNSVGNRGEGGVEKALQPFAGSGDSVVAEAAIVALGKIGTVEGAGILQALPQKSLVVYQALARTADRLANVGKKSDAARVYGSLVGGSVSASVQIAAMRGLTLTDPARAREAALAGLKSSDAEVQVAAAAICASIPDVAATKASVTIWPALPVGAQTALLAGFAARGEASAAPLAEKAVTSDDPTLRLTALRAAATLSRARAVPLLAKMAAQGNNDDKETARQELIQMPGKEAELAIDQQARQGVAPVRLALLPVLAERGTPEGRAALWDAANGSDERLASEALKTLGRTATGTDTAGLLKALLTAKSDTVRDAAQEAIVTSGQRGENREAVTTAVIGALPGAPVVARGPLLGVLASVGGDQALAALTAATKAPEPEVKSAAISALADTWGDARALPVLLNLAKAETGKTNRVLALRGYIRLVGQDDRAAADDRTSRFKDAIAAAERPEEKRQALGVLRECRTPAAVDLAASLLDDTALFDEAADTVLYLAAEQKKGDTTLPAVKGPATTAALDKIIKQAKDENVRAQAQKLK